MVRMIDSARFSDFRFSAQMESTKLSRAVDAFDNAPQARMWRQAKKNLCIPCHTLNPAVPGPLVSNLHNLTCFRATFRSSWRRGSASCIYWNALADERKGSERTPLICEAGTRRRVVFTLAPHRKRYTKQDSQQNTAHSHRSHEHARAHTMSFCQGSHGPLYNVSAIR